MLVSSLYLSNKYSLDKVVLPSFEGSYFFDAVLPADLSFCVPHWSQAEDLHMCPLSGAVSANVLGVACKLRVAL